MIAVFGTRRQSRRWTSIGCLFALFGPRGLRLAIAPRVTRVFRNDSMARPLAAPRSGAAATELAVVLPLLIMFALATADFGRFAYVAIELDNAVRVGAERGATRSFTDFTRQAWEDNLKDRLNEELADLKSGWLNNLQVTVTTSSTTNNLARVQVAADGEFAPLINWPFAASVFSLHREISVRQFR
jgi:Flp pilus assembly protein TadG